MKAALIFTGSSPVLVLTGSETIESSDFVRNLEARGITHFIAREVPLELVRERYGAHFSAAVGKPIGENDLRVLDMDGHHVFVTFSPEELGPPVQSPPSKQADPEMEMDEEMESEWLWAAVDEYGNLVDSSYLPMLGSRLVPPIPMEAGVSPRRIRFKIDRRGILYEGSPRSLDGRKLVFSSRSNPALGRTDTVMDTCIWRSEDGGCWRCD